LFATWHSIFNPAVDRARELLAEGGVRSVRIEWREDVKKWHPGQDWVWEPGGFGRVRSRHQCALDLRPDHAEHALRQERRTRLSREPSDPDRGHYGLFHRRSVARRRLSADFDWREKGAEKWHMKIETADGRAARLFKGGAALAVDEKLVVDAAQ